MFQTILVTLDGSTLAERALPAGTALARALDARLVLVRVANEGATAGRDAGGTLTVEDKRLADEQERRAVAEERAGVKEEEHLLSTDPRMVERAQAQVRGVAEAERYLTGVAERLAGEGIRVETAVPFGAPVEGILTEIDLHAAGLVVMCSHGKSALLQLIAGSVTQAVLARSPVPVMVVPPAERF